MAGLETHRDDALEAARDEAHRTYVISMSALDKISAEFDDKVGKLRELKSGPVHHTVGKVSYAVVVPKGEGAEPQIGTRSTQRPHVAGAGKHRPQSLADIVTPPMIVALEVAQSAGPTEEPTEKAGVVEEFTDAVALLRQKIRANRERLPEGSI